MKHKRWRIILEVGVVLLGIGTNMGVADEWQARAKIEAPAPGIVEAVLPPELIYTGSRESLDLVLIGPDGLPRSFELYRREKTGRVEWPIAPLDVTFQEPDCWVWEGQTNQIVEADQIQIEVADKDFVAQVDAAAEREGVWIVLKKNVALFKINGQLRTLFEIEKNRYQRLRFTFKSFDKKYRRRFSPLLKVSLSGEQTGKEHYASVVFPEFQQYEGEHSTEVRGILPGFGLWIDTVRLNTQAQFQGSIEIGFEKVSEGKQQFRCLRSFSLDHVNRDKQNLSLAFDGIWPGRNMILRLNPQGTFVGPVTNLAISVKRPRLVFWADAEGGYIVMSGVGSNHAVLEYPGDERRRVDYEAFFSPVEINRDRRLGGVLDKYRITGGPFNESGYTWNSPVSIPAPGYYRLVLNMDTSLEKRHQDIRIVKEKTQVPYILGGNEEREVDLMPTTEIVYLPNKNRTTITVILKKASPNWTRLVLGASGIFKRSLSIETPTPGNMEWKKWRNSIWENRGQKETLFMLDLYGHSDMDQIRILMDHGDNEPVNVTRVAAFYRAPTFLFIAHAPGVYEVYGGHSNATSPQYDLSLVQESLLEELPHTLYVDKIVPIDTTDFKRSFERIFSDRGWGLYAMLGIVTLVLLIFVVRLFPREEPP